MKKRFVYIGADHAGFKLKEKLLKELGKKYDVIDVGGFGKENDDYPDYAFALGKGVVKDRGSLGILICGTGTGMVMAANRVKGVRAAVGYDAYSVRKGREDNDINVLCLRGRKFSERKNLRLVKIFLKERFGGGVRHRRRLRKIAKFSGGKC
jgi:ribose 5-phosphate isomerase B